MMLRLSLCPPWGLRSCGASSGLLLSPQLVET